MSKTYMVIGGRGQLGSDIVKMLSLDDRDKVISLTSKEIEIRDIESIDMWVNRFRPDVVINTAAYHDLNKCEENAYMAFDVNTLAVKNLADICNKYDAILMHFSTDYVFNGTAWGGAGHGVFPFTESSSPNPINVYGMSKFAGELMAASAQKYYILRVSSLYGNTLPSGKSHNFPSLMLKLGREKGKVSVVNDIWMTPTFTLNIADRVKKILDGKIPYGLYHCSDAGCCTWYEFAKEIFKIKGIKVEVEPVRSNYFPSKAQRPQHSALNSNKLRFYVGSISYWEDAIKQYLEGVQ